MASFVTWFDWRLLSVNCVLRSLCCSWDYTQMHKMWQLPPRSLLRKATGPFWSSSKHNHMIVPVHLQVLGCPAFFRSIFTYGSNKSCQCHTLSCKIPKQGHLTLHRHRQMLIWWGNCVICTSYKKLKIVKHQQNSTIMSQEPKFTYF